MKIAIIGGGISGFATYLALKKRLPNPPPPAAEHEYTIFEAYNTPRNDSPWLSPSSDRSATLGAGLILPPNGVRCLERIDQDVAFDVKRAGNELSIQKIRNQYGWTLARILFEYEGEKSLLISRYAFWSCLRNYIPDDIIITKRVSCVTANPEGKNIIQFTDDSPDFEADIIIGTDGLKSVTKRALFVADKEDPYPPEFGGVVGVGGVIPAGELRHLIDPDAITVTFGGHGFFAYGFTDDIASHLSVSPLKEKEIERTVLWLSTYEAESCPNPKLVDKDAVHREIKRRLKRWKDPVIQKILDTVKIETVYPQCTTPDLPTWYKDGVVLIGDAAHTLSPTTGQGACQGLEDAESFSMLFSHFLKRGYSSFPGGSPEDLARTERSTLAFVMEKHMNIRIPRIHAIKEQDRAFNSRKLSKAAEFLLYAVLFIMGKLPRPEWLMNQLGYDIVDAVNNEIVKADAEQ